MARLWPCHLVGADDARTPACTIIGGPNGSGKSTLYDRLDLPGLFVNADVIARALNPGRPEAASLLAGRRTLAELAKVLGARESFVYETTLSSRQSVELMRASRTAGYEVGLVFVALNSADLNVQRVAERVARGGHHIPDDVVRRRYEKALSRLPEAIRLANGSMVFDNSLFSGPRLLLQIRGAAIEVNTLDEADAFHMRLAAMAAEALSMSTGAVLRAGTPA